MGKVTYYCIQENRVPFQYADDLQSEAASRLALTQDGPVETTNASSGTVEWLEC